HAADMDGAGVLWRPVQPANLAARARWGALRYGRSLRAGAPDAALRCALPPGEGAGERASPRHVPQTAALVVRGDPLLRVRPDPIAPPLHRGGPRGAGLAARRRRILHRA